MDVSVEINIEEKKPIINKNSKTICVCCFDTIVGKVFSAADETFVYILAFEGCATLAKRFPKICDQLGVCQILEIKSKVLRQLENELKAYFERTLRKFTVPIKTVGTRFYQAVWAKLTELPYGSTLTYKHLAKKMGYPASNARAIGNACANNTLLLLIPCHRVVASGSRGGYNCGNERKAWLINNEREIVGKQRMHKITSDVKKIKQKDNRK